MRARFCKLRIRIEMHQAKSFNSLRYAVIYVKYAFPKTLERVEIVTKFILTILFQYNFLMKCEIFLSQLLRLFNLENSFQIYISYNLFVISMSSASKIIFYKYQIPFLKRDKLVSINRITNFYRYQFSNCRNHHILFLSF